MILLQAATAAAATVPSEVTAAISAFAAVAGAISATSAAISAKINYQNTRNFQLQQMSTTIDACVSASAALKAATHKVIEFKANKVNKIDDIPDAMIWGAYDDAWAKWVVLYQTFRIAQRYSNKFAADAPDQASELLSRLRISLRDPNWSPGGPHDPKDIRTAMDNIVAEIHRVAGLIDPATMQAAA